MDDREYRIGGPYESAQEKPELSPWLEIQDKLIAGRAQQAELVAAQELARCDDSGPRMSYMPTFQQVIKGPIRTADLFSLEHHLKLVKCGYVGEFDGYTYLRRAGVKVALRLGLIS